MNRERTYWEILLELIHQGSEGIHSEKDAQAQFISIMAWAYAGTEMNTEAEK